MSPDCPQPWGGEGYRQVPQSSWGFILSVEGMKSGEGTATNTKPPVLPLLCGREGASRTVLG